MKRQWRKGSVSGGGGRRRGLCLWLFCHELFAFQVLLVGACCLLLMAGSEARSLAQQAAESRGQLDNDVMGLLAFKKSSVMSDPNGFLSSWVQTNSSNPCSWRGVSCSSNEYVVALNLTQAGLIGSLFLSNLTSSLPNLTSLDLSGNLFSSGDLSFGSVTSSCNIQTLDLSSNNLSSPFNLACHSLLYLDISGNQISAGSTFLSQTLTNNQNLILFNVSSNKVSGNLPSVISSSRNLSALDLSHNLLSGNIPPSFLVDGPASLANLDLSRNNFSGLFSSFEFGDCGKLTLLNMSHNILSGNAFPTSLNNCTDLVTLDLSGNRLQGNIPGGLLGNSLKNLRSLSLAHNEFFGDIPPELGQICGSLEELDLSGNGLVGGLPQTFASCASLRNLNLGRNQLSGDFIDTVISNLPNLTYLYLAFNNISGAVPVSLTNITQLQVLDISSNNFTGNIPSGFCSSSSASPFLQKLQLANNFLTGTVPVELGNCKELNSFDFSFNDLSGSIPSKVWSLPKLSDVIAWANQLTGEIPEDICVNGGNLEMLILNNNFITGSIPQSIGSCSNLIWVSLSSNRITGVIPSSIGNLLNLAILQLGNNSISGPIPPELGNCRSLIWLELNSNNLTGSIPPEFADQTGMVVLVPEIVSGKQFAFVRNEGGTACRGAGGLIEFEGVRADRLESHPMVHTCPSTRVYTGLTVYTFASNGSLIYLDLSYNDLSGNIPGNYGPMIYLQVLNLGHNDLTGTIPDNLGDMKSIGVLDLSHNHLQGSIPGSLTSPSFLSDFDVSNNNLSGPIPSGGQLFTFPASRYENNSGLCGLPLPPCSSGAGTGASFINRRKMPMAKVMIVAIMVSLLFIVGLSLALCRMKQNQQVDIKREKYIESLSTSASSSWKLSSIPEPLIINVATFEKPLRKLTFADLLEATNGFSANSLIGAGGFGEVYKARLKDECTVAIKKLVHVTGQGDREFMAEMETIGKIKHRNLVPLLGYCKIGEERLLVYEYMKWGSLDSVLHDRVKSGAPKLDWPARKKIFIGSARGLAFLHHSCIPHIIHRDMKSSNVLLDEDFVARVSDFGMARLVNALDTHLSVSTLAGTPGYVPPEYYQSFRCTAKGDVYSYGVILLELLSGKRPIDTIEYGDDNNLVGWAKQLQKENRANEILDPELMRSESGEAELYHYLKIAFSCLDDRPFRRPTMIQVMAMFKELQVDTEHDLLDGFSLKDIYETRDKNLAS